MFYKALYKPYFDHASIVTGDRLARVCNQTASLTAVELTYVRFKLFGVFLFISYFRSKHISSAQAVLTSYHNLWYEQSLEQHHHLM